MPRIVITGPESSGKTTLAEALGAEWRAWYVSEVAREYVEDLGRPYQEADLLSIAKAQLALEDGIGEEFPNARMVCDTDLITIRIWSEEKYGRCDPWIVERTEQRHYDHWLLCAPDIPWEPDPLRENPHDRHRLFQRHVQLLDTLRKPYTIVHGTRAERLAQALTVVWKVESSAAG